MVMPFRFMAILFFLLIGASFVSLSFGSAGFISFLPFGNQGSADQEGVMEFISWSVRAPRLMLGIVVGGGLAVIGCVLQIIFRNPLADPSLLGISSGAALGALFALALAGGGLVQFSIYLGPFFLPFFAFMGALIVTVALLSIGKKHGGEMNTDLLLLKGIALNALCNTAIGVLIYRAGDQELRQMTFWLLGGLGGTTWTLVLPISIIAILGIISIGIKSNILNLLALGHREAGHLGIHVEKNIWVLIVVSSFITGVIVSVSGIIGFVGLIVPHLARFIVGSDHRVLLPVSVLLGAIIVVFADLLSRLLVPPAELPIGLMTSAFGGPFLFWRLYRRAKNI